MTGPGRNGYPLGAMECEPIWEWSPEELELPEGEVHVWRVCLAQPEGRVDALSRLLSTEERVRAGRFVAPDLGAHFAVARGVLRQLLGKYLGVAPRELRFAYGRHGKPGLAEPQGQSRLCFNLSHSHQLALYAVSRGREVGIDVEHPRPGVDVERLARRFFAPQEIDGLLRLPVDRRREGFYNCWTRKEAYLKARGEGITVALDSFAVTLEPGAPAALLRCAADPDEVERWRLQALFPGEGYVAALCAAGDDWRLRCWQWPDE